MSPSQNDGAILWRCSGCGNEYISDVGTCGRNEPFECREPVAPVTELEVLTDVIAALRLAAVGSDEGRFKAVAEAILEEAPDTPGSNTGGSALLIRLHRLGALEFSLR